MILRLAEQAIHSSLSKLLVTGMLRKDSGSGQHASGNKYYNPTHLTTQNHKANVMEVERNSQDHIGHTLTSSGHEPQKFTMLEG